MWRMPLACALFALAAAAQPATITGRVFDVYHRPVQSARVVTMTRKTSGGREQLVAGTQAIVDEAGMYRLSLPPGRYILAVLPPPGEMDFASVFPAYFYDTIDFAKAQPVEVRAEELRPFTDFLLLEVESHQLAGRVTGVHSDGITVALHAARGYTGALRVTITDPQGQFRFQHLPAGSYEVTASSGAKSGSVHVDLTAPEIKGIQIHLRPAAR